ncbi:STAS domain-containing protein [Streptacidiphilus sp. P02-A3a]|uniref:STAS domain-containing protein n=1 Tax=Streptacidiphilus sp. P02-A3a TaxID=2704468 RepID=UPI0015FA7AEE|nr:STAS domain-containing protein [Streptacidiphilus sp. P02-A3a]QMU72516.1 STAS domain-containing protein [Streptacidiphilus sp. P02-A3a]
MRIRGDHDELAIEGRLDVRTAADARSVLHRAVDHGHGDLVLDLSALDSWDATGLGVLMGTHRRAGRCGRRMVLRGVPAQLQRLLVATKLHRILAIEGYVPDLVADLAQDLAGGLAGELPGPVLPVSAG